MTSSQFEIEFVASPGTDIRSSLFPAKQIRWVLKDEGSSSGDTAPDPGEVTSFELEAVAVFPYPEIGLSKEQPEHLRIVTYNALWDNLFKEREPLFRILNAIIDFIKNARRPGVGISLAGGTPIVVIGDFNLVGDARQLDTLLSGPGTREGPSPDGSGPDWDGTDLADLLPYHNGAPETYTWRSSWRSGFSPSRLDLVIYTDSVLTPVKSYILCTETMETEEPSAYGLCRGDSSTLSDHCPIVVDFVFSPAPARSNCGRGFSKIRQN